MLGSVIESGADSKAALHPRVTIVSCQRLWSGIRRPSNSAATKSRQKGCLDL